MNRSAVASILRAMAVALEGAPSSEKNTMTSLTARVETHQQNKREAFDGMRAYHQSEIAHKGHAIEVLKTILTAILTIYAGLVLATVAQGLSKSIVAVASAVALISTSLCAHLVVWATNQKIDQDNARYEVFRDEYKAERRILGLDAELASAGFTSTWTRTEDRKKSGYSATKRILRIFAWALTTIAAVGSALAVVAAK